MRQGRGIATAGWQASSEAFFSAQVELILGGYKHWTELNSVAHDQNGTDLFCSAPEGLEPSNFETL